METNAYLAANSQSSLINSRRDSLQENALAREAARLKYYTQIAEALGELMIKHAREDETGKQLNLKRAKAREGCVKLTCYIANEVLSIRMTPDLENETLRIMADVYSRNMAKHVDAEGHGRDTSNIVKDTLTKNGVEYEKYKEPDSMHPNLIFMDIPISLLDNILANPDLSGNQMGEAARALCIFHVSEDAKQIFAEMTRGPWSRYEIRPLIIAASLHVASARANTPVSITEVSKQFNVDDKKVKHIIEMFNNHK